MGVYSFIDVQAAISGPGGGFSLGYGSGNAEEGISVEMAEEKDNMVLGAGGEIMHSLRAANAGRITVRLLKTSPVNAQLSALYNFQRGSSGNWGQNTFRVANVVSGDVIAGSEMAFVKQSDLVYAKDGNVNTWVFQGNVNELLGTGTPVAQ